MTLIRTSAALTPRKIRRYGWRRDSLDQRDRAMRVVAPTTLPSAIDLSTRHWMPGVYDQGNLGSCTANAIAGAFEFAVGRQQLFDFMPSRLAIYYGERVIEGTVNSDAGAEIRDGMKVVAKQGAAPEALWPYVISKFAQKPPAAYYTAAKSHVCISYEAVPQTEQALKTALAAGYPIVFGISVYESFESDAAAKTGTIPMPRSSEQLLGGHAILMTGYTKTLIRFRNSWGQWGHAGYGTMPLAYVLNPDLASDFWIAKIVE